MENFIKPYEETLFHSNRGLDFFAARYYASAQGRFTTADSVLGSTLNPQTFNLYAYVKNNPLKFIDPTGHFSTPAFVAAEQKREADRIEKILTNGLKAGAGS